MNVSEVLPDNPIAMSNCPKQADSTLCDARLKRLGEGRGGRGESEYGPLLARKGSLENNSVHSCPIRRMSKNVRLVGLTSICHCHLFCSAQKGNTGGTLADV